MGSVLKPTTDEEWRRAVERDRQMQGRRGNPFPQIAGIKGGLLDTRYYTETEIDQMYSASKVVKPASVTVGSGSASWSSDGLITFTGVSSLSLSDIFDGTGLDMYQIIFTCLTSVDLENIVARFRTHAGVDLSAANSYGAYFYGIVSGSASNGGTSGATMAQMYFGYGRTLNYSTNVIHISKPMGAAVKELINRTYTYNYVDYNMSNFTGSATAYSSLTIFPSAGIMTGAMKVIKL